MSEDLTLARRFNLTPAGIVITVFVALIATILLVLSVRRALVTRSIRDWFCPHGSVLTGFTNVHVRTVVLTTPDSFTNVAAWYRDKLGLRYFGAGFATAFKSGMFSVSEVIQIAPVQDTNAAAATWLIARRDERIIIHASWNRADNYTTVSIVMSTPTAHTNSELAALIAKGLKPEPSNPTGGTEWNKISAYSYHLTNSFAVTRRYWDDAFAKRARGVAAMRAFFPHAPDEEFGGQAGTLVPLPGGAGAGARETDRLFITAHSVTLIHLENSTNDTSELVIGTVAH